LGLETIYRLTKNFVTGAGDTPEGVAHAALTLAFITLPAVTHGSISSQVNHPNADAQCQNN